MTTFNQRLAQSIKKSGMTQTVIARHLGVSPAAVTAWKQGSKMPTRDKVTRIADALGVDGLWLETGIELCPLCVIRMARRDRGLPSPGSG